jgi:biopolymer transport protein ExbD
MRLPRSYRGRPVISLTPMIDMSFLLITFFVMTLRLSMSTAEQEVKLPHADQAKSQHESQVEVVTLVVDRDGRIFWGERQLAMEEIQPALRQRVEAGRQVKVALRADARSPFRRVRAAMRAAADAGIETMSIAALRAEDRS